MAMATTQPLTPSTSNSSISARRGCVKTESVSNNDSFPAGLRVLVVDDDPICLLILDRMLRRCLYEVTTCGKATDALEMLRGNRDNFDLVISDVYMPDMDGFKLLELVGLEMDLPVIMMSANGETSAVMKGIKHGACDYLLKPVRMEELRNIWQHVVRRKWRVSRQSTSHEDDKGRRGGDDSDYTSPLVNEGFDGSWKQPKKRKDVKEEEDDPDQDNDDSSTTKKPRVVWSVDLHQQFVNAVNQLGIDKAVPKRILELMNVQGLTRENVASHLQKYRLYLKRISGVAHQQGGLNPSFPGSTDSSFGPIGASGLGGLGDLRTLAGSGQLSPQALMSTLQAGLLGRLGQPNNLQLGSVDPSLLLQIAALGANNSPLGRPSFGQSIQGNYQAGPADMKQLQASQQLGAFAGSLDKGTGGIALQSPSQQQQQQHLPAAGNLGGMGQLVGINNNIPKIGSNNNALLMQALQQQVGASQLKGPGALTLPTGGVSGQPGVLSDIGAWSSPISSVNASTTTGSGVMSQSSPLMQGPSSPLVPTGSSSGLLGSLARASADNKNLHSSSTVGINISIPSPVNATSPLGSVGLEDSARLRTVGSLGAVSENIPQSFSSYTPKFTSVSGGASHGQSLQRNQVGWPGYGLNQELGQVNNPVVSPRYSQVSSNHCLSLGSGQEPGQPRTGFGAGFPSNFSMDSLKPSVTATLSRSDLSTADSDLKLREGLMLEAKQEQTWLAEPLSDELLNIVLKQQQQEGLEVGLAAPDNYSLDNA